MPEQPRHCIVAIVPCNDIEASTAFYGRLGLYVHSDYGRYRILSDGKGWLLHLSSEAPEGWVAPGRNPNGLYLYLEKNFTGRQVQRAHMQLARHRREWVAPPIPPQHATVGVADVLAAPPGPPRDAMIRSWCEAVWQDWLHARPQIVALGRELEILSDQ